MILLDNTESRGRLESVARGTLPPLQVSAARSSTKRGARTGTFQLRCGMRCGTAHVVA